MVVPGLLEVSRPKTASELVTANRSGRRRSSSVIDETIAPMRSNSSSLISAPLGSASARPGIFSAVSVRRPIVLSRWTCSKKSFKSSAP